MDIAAPFAAFEAAANEATLSPAQQAAGYTREAGRAGLVIVFDANDERAGVAQAVVARGALVWRTYVGGPLHDTLADAVADFAGVA